MQRQLRVTVDGHEYQVTVEDLTDTGSMLYPQPGTMSPTATSAPAEAGPASSPTASALPSAAAGTVLAPMTGVLVELLVTIGKHVSAGDTVAVVEAMKMKTPIVVEQTGTVASLDLAVGDPVQVGQPILTLS